jgi:glycogen synthase
MSWDVPASALPREPWRERREPPSVADVSPVVAGSEVIAKLPSRRIMLVGGYPPPYGGCNVHVQRLRRAFDGGDWSVAVVDLYGSRGDVEPGVIRCGGRAPANLVRAVAALRRQRPRIAHVHVSAMRTFALAGWPLLWALPRTTRSVLTVHSGSFVGEVGDAPGWRRALIASLVRRFDHIIAVNEEQRNVLCEIGVDSGRITVVPAFVPPIAEDGPESRAVRSARAAGGAVVVVSGYAQRHYGFHDVIAAVGRLCAGGRNVTLAVCWYHSYDPAYLAVIEAQLRDVPSLVFRDLSPGRFAAVLAAGDCYVRATDRDGDAVAIREAAFFGRPVIASDAVARCEGVRLYSHGNVVALASAIATCLSDPEAGRVKGTADGVAAIRAVYELVSR